MSGERPTAVGTLLAVLDSLKLTRAAPDDAPRLLRLYEAVDRDELGEVDISLADIDAMLRDPRAALDKSAVLARPDGVPVAVLVPTRQPGSSTHIDLELIVEPGNPELFEELLARAEAEWSDDADASTLDLWVTTPAAEDILSRRGFARTATFIRYGRELAGNEPRPVERPDARVRLVSGRAEWQLLHRTLQRVFSDAREGFQELYDDWAERMRSADVNDPSQWWLIETRGGKDACWKAAGVLQANRQDAEGRGGAHGSRTSAWFPRHAAAAWAGICWSGAWPSSPPLATGA